jgi:hypothetical protein
MIGFMRENGVPHWALLAVAEDIVKEDILATGRRMESKLPSVPNLLDQMTKVDVSTVMYALAYVRRFDPRIRLEAIQEKLREIASEKPPQTVLSTSTSPPASSATPVASTASLSAAAPDGTPALSARLTWAQASSMRTIMIKGGAEPYLNQVAKALLESRCRHWLVIPRRPDLRNEMTKADVADVMKALLELRRFMPEGERRDTMYSELRAIAERVRAAGEAPTSTSPSASSSTPVSFTASTAVSGSGAAPAGSTQLTVFEAAKMIEVMKQGGATFVDLEWLATHILASEFGAEAGLPRRPHLLQVMTQSDVSLVMDAVADLRRFIKPGPNRERMFERLCNISKIELPGINTLSASQARTLWATARERWHLSDESDLRAFKSLANKLFANESDGKRSSPVAQEREVDALLTGSIVRYARAFLHRVNRELFDTAVVSSGTSTDSSTSDRKTVTRAIAKVLFRELETACGKQLPAYAEQVRSLLSHWSKPDDYGWHADLRSFLLGKPEEEARAVIESLRQSSLRATSDGLVAPGRIRLQLDLQQLGLTVQSVRGDGNCLFSSLQQAGAHAVRAREVPPVEGSEPVARDMKSNPTYDHWSAQVLRVKLLDAVRKMSDETLRTVSALRSVSSEDSIDQVRSTTMARLADGLRALTPPAESSGEGSLEDQRQKAGDDEIDTLRDKVAAEIRMRIWPSLTFSSTSSDPASCWGNVSDVATYALVHKRPVVYLLGDGTDDIRGLCDADGKRSQYPNAHELDKAIQRLRQAGRPEPLYVVNRIGNHFDWAVRAQAKVPGEPVDPKSEKS